MMSAQKLFKYAEFHRSLHDYDLSYVYLKNGISDYPLFKDKYGHPLFRKEMVRTLVSQGHFESAKSYIEPGEDWADILFARAYDQAGERDAAEQYWDLVRSTNPKSMELKLRNLSKNGLIRGSKVPEPFVDLISRTDISFDVIFDVGANIGQSSTLYADVFPRAKIFAFEPIAKTFGRLSQNIEKSDRIQLFNMAFSQSDSTIAMESDGVSTMNRAATDSSQATESVLCRRVDTFCREREIDSIDFLKIDTEGHEMSVISGIGSMMDNISVIQCEVSANRYNKYHCHYGDIFDFMTGAGFHLFKIYGQTWEWGGGGKSVLRRFDAVFINGRVVGDLSAARLA